jgi:hypothetical protein
VITAVEDVARVSIARLAVPRLFSPNKLSDSPVLSYTLQDTGQLTSDGDGGFCPSIATQQCAAGRRRASGSVPRAPKHKGPRGEITKAMRNRSMLRKDKPSIVWDVGS